MIAVEALRGRVHEFFYPPTAPEKPLRVVTPEEMSLQPLPREFVLTYLVDKLGRLSRTQAEVLAEEIFNDTTHGDLRPLGEICRKISLPIPRRDILLDRTVLSYSQKEMSVQEPEPWRVGCNRPIASYIDYVIGWKHSRPLLHDIYSEYSACDLHVLHEGDKDLECYVTAAWGKDIAEVMPIGFSHREWQKNTAVISNSSIHSDRFF